MADADAGMLGVERGEDCRGCETANELRGLMLLGGDEKVWGLGLL